MEKVYTLKKENLEGWLKALAENAEVFVPVQDKKNSLINFLSLSRIEQDLGWKQDEEHGLVLNLTEKTRLSPKHIIYPMSEDLLEFEYKKNTQQLDDVEINISPANPEGQKIIFGLKPCDVQAIARLDAVFGEGVVKDHYYMERRKQTVLIAGGCDTVFEDCFCTQVGGSPYNFQNTDIGFYPEGDSYVFIVYTEKGQEVARDSSGYLQPVEDGARYLALVKEKDEQSSGKIAELWEGKDYQSIPDIMNQRFEDVEWKKVSAKCIGCGACTFVCPTCYCFDIRDEKDNQQGQRYRCWDFCTSYLYTLEASGHNPRAELYQRYRNKINCKYNYNYRRHGHLYCVGCGRCIDVCPVNMDIREIVAAIINK